MDESVIKINHLCKKFGDVFAVKDSDMTVPKGCVYGFLGANGAGKTTIFKMLTGLLSPTSGDVKVLGWDVVNDREKILREVGSLIEAPVFYEHLSTTKNLRLHLDPMGIRDMRNLFLDLIKTNGMTILLSSR